VGFHTFRSRSRNVAKATLRTSQLCGLAHARSLLLRASSERITQAFATFFQSVPKFDGAAMSAEPCFLQTIDVRQLS
jgi:hypothetical protein